ncbi:beta strand repeat-containing protein [Actibacterium ureilyticum]|uniref:beta strand repeat-containing protein n=1 Tax=Actibacterium ureilyticum TaxID=1590614 RepID=UPI000BAAD7DA|nr:autotransporter outer membrane beta-barrel domain-containing protein [Actibacterium ureilyticum]
MKTFFRKNPIFTLRGGRMTKYKGRVASFAPMIGQVSTVAIGAALMLGAGATLAGSCVDQDGGAFICSGPANDITPEDTILIDEPVSPTTITTEPGFGHNATGDAIRIRDAGTVTFTDANGSQITGGEDGIDTLTDDGISITTTGHVAGGNDGIIARNVSTGAMSIDVVDVTGATGRGIFANNSDGRNDNPPITDLTITASGTVQGATDGIVASLGVASGAFYFPASGDLSINVVDVIGSDGIGIHAVNTGTDLSVTSIGQIGAAQHGVLAINQGQGATHVDVARVTSTAADGVRVINESLTTDLSITAPGTVAGNQNGIYAINTGTGALTIDVADVSADNGRGIQAGNYGTDLSITATGTIAAAQDGIFAQNVGTGALTIDVADVTSTSGKGIDASNGSAGTDLSITSTGHIQAAQHGILAINQGTGALSIDVGDVTSTDEHGISAVNSIQGTDLSITASGAVTVDDDGIYASNSGSGALTIDVTDVSSANSLGVQARNNGTDLSITATGAIQAALDGISVDHTGTGAVSIDVTDVTSTGEDGIFAYLDSGATGLTLTASGSITASDDGIFVENLGSGATTINVVDVASATGDGIVAFSSAPGTDLSITSTGTIATVQSGIKVDNRGSGALTIDVSDVISTDGKGIEAINRSTGTDLTITASGTVSASDTAIEAINDGSGTLSVAVNTVHSDEGYGIEAINDNEFDSDLLISATGHVSGFKGIFADQGNSGVLSIDVADVTATGGHGILATSFGADMTITASGTITAFENGIDAEQRGDGDLTIDVADVTGGSGGASGYGIYATGDDETTRMTITSSGHVTGTTGGITAQTNGGDSDMILDVVDVTATGGNGIQADHRGADLSITSSGTVTGSQTGIAAFHSGDGALTINATNALGTNGRGIFAQSYGTDISITATGDIAGEDGGIAALNYGTGVTSVTVSGNVSSTDGPAIQATSQTTSTIELLDGAVVDPASGQAIVNGSDAGTLILRDGSRLTGSVVMNRGADTLIIEGGADIRDATLFNGGDDADDALVFSGFTGTFDSAVFTGWENLTAQDGSSLTLDSTDTGGLDAILIDTNASIVASNAGFALDGELQVNATGRFLAGAAGAGDASFARTVLNDGLISAADGASGDRLSFGADLTGKGTIGLDINLTEGTNDAVFVAGNTAGARQGIELTKSGRTVDAAQTFTLVTVAGTSSAADFRLVNADFVTNGGVQAISDGEIAYLLEHDAVAGTFVLNPFAKGDLIDNPGGAFLAAGAEQFSTHLTFGSALGRVMGATPRDGRGTQTVSRALHEFSTATLPPVWVQATGQRSSYTADDREVDTDIADLRFGAALPLADVFGGRLVGGLEFGVSRISSDVETALTRAAIDTDAHDVTLSALWVADDYFYTDVQLRYARFDSQVTPRGGKAVDVNGDGYGLSVEMGKPFELQNGLTLIPQAQIMYSDIDIDDVADLGGGGLNGSVSDGDNLTGRLGLRAEKNLSGGSVLFGQVDYFHAFDNTTAVDFGAETITTARDRSSVALTLGGQMAISQNTTLFGEVTGATGFGGSNEHSFGGSVGFRIEF